ncbi:peptidase MA family metallohydrolase [Melghirimyces profundicolus]|nr:hypothetical protein [Melghirimyces profundicolus]
MFAQPVLHQGNHLLESWRLREYDEWKSNRVTVFHPPGLRSQAKLVAVEAERVLTTFQKRFGFQVKRPVPVFLFPNRPALRQHFSWNKGQSATGIYFSGAIYLLNPETWHEGFPSATGEPEQWARLFHENGPLYHEMAHFYLDLETGGNYPLWYTEAFAQWVEYQELGYEWVVPANNLKWHELYDYRDLDENFSRLPNQALAYRQSFRWLRWMVEQHGESSLYELHQRLSRSVPFDIAWKRVFGSSPEASFEEWRRQME